MQQKISREKYELPEIAKISLSEAVPWIPHPVYSTASESDTLTQVTTLDNGIRVASEPKFGSFCTVGGMTSNFLLQIYYLHVRTTLLNAINVIIYSKFRYLYTLTFNMYIVFNINS